MLGILGVRAPVYVCDQVRGLLCFLIVWLGLLGWPAPAFALGEPCSLASECASGFCVEGVCCDSACTGQCETCAGATPGQCQAVPAGQMRPSQPCSGAFGDCGGTCDGVERGRCIYPDSPNGTCSGNQSCAQGRATESACSLGSCVIAETECGLYRCGSSACSPAVKLAMTVSRVPSVFPKRASPPLRPFASTITRPSRPTASPRLAEAIRAMSRLEPARPAAPQMTIVWVRARSVVAVNVSPR